jgi:single-strand DNA-binding protein
MANFNSVVVVGRLTRDPELKYSPSGAPVCSFSIATSQRWTKSDGARTESTTFLDVDVWRRLAEICSQFLKKGREVLVMGSLKQARWVDKTTQQPRSKIRVIAQNVQFLWKRETAPGGAGPGAEGSEEAEADGAAEAPAQA